MNRARGLTQPSFLISNTKRMERSEQRFGKG
jgi:hypothetical protein